MSAVIEREECASRTAHLLIVAEPAVRPDPICGSASDESHSPPRGVVDRPGFAFA